MIVPQFGQARSFAGQTAIVQAANDFHWGMIARSGSWMIEPQFRVFNDFVEDVAVVDLLPCLQTGLIDRQGNVLIPLGRYALEHDEMTEGLLAARVPVPRQVKMSEGVNREEKNTMLVQTRGLVGFLDQAGTFESGGLRQRFTFEK